MALAWVGLALMNPSAHASGTSFTWADASWGSYLNGGQGKRDVYEHPLYGVYCHEMDPNQVRNIDITAYYGEYIWTGWARFQTDGYRSGYPGYAMRGACYNPHSVGYPFNAHDNYYI